MKTPTYETSPGALASFLLSITGRGAQSQGAISDCYTITLRDGRVLRWTSAREDVVMGSRTFYAKSYVPPPADPIRDDPNMPYLLASLADLVHNHLPGDVPSQPLELTLLEVGYGSESAVSAVLTSLADLVTNHLP